METVGSRTVSLLTSLHVRNYWRGFGRDRSLFYVRDVSTLFLEEQEIEPRSFSENLPPPRQMRFRLTMSYRLRELESASDLDELQALTGRNLDADQLSEFIYEWKGMFTLPFEDDSFSYLQALDKEIVNSTNWLWMDFQGVEDPSVTRRNLVTASSVAILVAILILAGVYLVTKFRKGDNATSGSDSPMVGAMVGVNANENILISESYDDDYQYATPRNHNESSLLLQSHSRFEDQYNMDPPVEVIKDAGNKYGSPATAISDVASSLEIGGKYASPSQGTNVSEGTNASMKNSQADADLSNQVSVNRDEEDEVATNDEHSTAESSSGPPPFVGDFQMEVKTLED